MYILKYECSNKTTVIQLDKVDLETIEENGLVLLAIKKGEETYAIYVNNCSLYCNGNLILHKTMEDLK